MPRHPSSSRTSLSLSDQVFSRLAARARERSEPVAPLHVGDTYRPPIPEAQAQAQLTEEHTKLHGYAPVQGLPELISAFQERVQSAHGVSLEPQNIQVMSGATAGLSVVITALLDPGDEVLLPSPFWPLIRGIIARRGAVPVQIPFFDRFEDPDFDVEAILEAKITPKTAALYINTPHNPTGAILPPRVIEAMLRVAARHDLWVLSDEAYEEIFFGEDRPKPVWTYPNAEGRTIANHTLSKSYGLAGARIGFAHGPSEVMKVIRSSQTFGTYCAPRPMQTAATQALLHGDGWLEEARRLYGEAAKLSADAIGVEAPAGGTFLFFDASKWLNAGDTSALPFLERALDAGVLLTPGSACGEAYQNWVRLCFTSVPIDELRAALEKLAPILEGRA